MQDLSNRIRLRPQQDGACTHDSCRTSSHGTHIERRTLRHTTIINPLRSDASRADSIESLLLAARLSRTPTAHITAIHHSHMRSQSTHPHRTCPRLPRFEAPRRATRPRPTNPSTTRRVSPPRAPRRLVLLVRRTRRRATRAARATPPPWQGRRRTPPRAGSAGSASPASFSSPAPRAAACARSRAAEAVAARGGERRRRRGRERARRRRRARRPRLAAPVGGGRAWAYP